MNKRIGALLIGATLLVGLLGSYLLTLQEQQVKLKVMVKIINYKN